jgi:hypothetical protein
MYSLHSSFRRHSSRKEIVAEKKSATRPSESLLRFLIFGWPVHSSGKGKGRANVTLETLATAFLKCVAAATRLKLVFLKSEAPTSVSVSRRGYWSSVGCPFLLTERPGHPRL